MKIAFINSATEWGGGEKWTLVTAEGLANRGHEVVFIGRPSSPITLRAKNMDMDAFPLSFNADYSPKTMLKATKILQNTASEVVVVHHNKDLRTAGVAAKLLNLGVVFRNGFPIIVNNLRHKQMRNVWDRIITNSHAIKQLYLSFGWIPENLIDVVHNGIDIPTNSITPLPLKQELFGSEKCLLALYFGRLTTVKKVNILIEAIHLLEQDSPWRLLIVGSGSEEDALRKLVIDLSLTDRVAFKGFTEDIYPLIKGSDLVMLSSSKEGMPNSLMEAMACGVAMASTLVGDTLYLLDEGGGFIIVDNVPNSWKNLLNFLTKNPHYLKGAAQIGHNRIKEHFSLSKMLDGVEECLNRALRPST